MASTANAREAYCSDAIIESILVGSQQTRFDEVEPEQDILPEQLADRLRLLFASVTSEELPAAIVRLLRQMNEVEGQLNRR